MKKHHEIPIVTKDVLWEIFFWSLSNKNSCVSPEQLVLLLCMDNMNHGLVVCYTLAARKLWAEFVSYFCVKGYLIQPTWNSLLTLESEPVKNQIVLQTRLILNYENELATMSKYLLRKSI